jgi:hypothetical protein
VVTTSWSSYNAKLFFSFKGTVWSKDQRRSHDHAVKGGALHVSFGKQGYGIYFVHGMLWDEAIFGEHEKPIGRKFPYENDKLGEVKFSYWRAWRIIEEFDALVDLSLSYNWARAMRRMEELRRRFLRWKKITDIQLDQFQSKSVFFFYKSDQPCETWNSKLYSYARFWTYSIFFNVNGAVVTQGWEQYNSFCNLASSNFKG